MKRKPIIGVIGAADANAELSKIAEDIGQGVAQRGWTLVTGGFSGVMEAASKGASDNGGTVVGILPTAKTADANPHVTIAIATNMGHARNAIIAHTSDVLVACGGGYGTLSEIALANKLEKKVFGFKSWEVEGVIIKKSVEEVMGELDAIFAK
jgi:uncharacterized protein (TIGR00725 family)